MYNEKIMKEFFSQNHLGEIRNANAIGASGNSVLGDIIKFYFIVEGEKIVEAKAKVFGCVAAFAVASVACEMLEGKTIAEALEFDTSKINEKLDGIPAEKGDILGTAKHAIVEAINYYFKKLEK